MPRKYPSPWHPLRTPPHPRQLLHTGRVQLSTSPIYTPEEPLQRMAVCTEVITYIRRNTTIDDVFVSLSASQRRAVGVHPKDWRSYRENDLPHERVVALMERMMRRFPTSTVEQTYRWLQPIDADSHYGVRTVAFHPDHDQHGPPLEHLLTSDRHEILYA